MSDEQATQEANPDSYESQVNSFFSDAWNEVYNEEDGAEAPSDKGSAGDAGAGEAGSAPAVESAGQAAAEPAGDGGGAEVPDAAAPADAGSVSAGEGAAAAAAAGGNQAPVAVNPATSTGVGSFRDAEPLFDSALSAIHERAEESYRARALEEIREEVAPEFLRALDQHPRMLVGDQVPSLKKQGETEILRDSNDAKDWQDGLRHMISMQVSQRAAGYAEEAKPLISTIQSSVELFRRNPDIVPGTKEFDPELATRFVNMSKSYEHREGDKMFGYRVDVQPLVANIREQLKAERAARPAQPPTQTARQAQAASQSRDQGTGRFDAPQAGIPSRAGMSGEDAEDFSAFWGTLNRSDMNF